MAKIKVDLSGVKTFFFEKGDKLALVVCLATAGLLVGYGVLSGMGARTAPNSNNKTWGDHYAVIAKDLQNRVRKGEGEIPAITITYPDPKWVPTRPSDEPFARLFEIGDMNNIKRLNPKVLPPRNRVDDKERDVQMNYIRGTYFGYEVDHGNSAIWVVKDAAPAAPVGGVPAMKKKDLMAAKKESTPTVVTRPVRMVVVHMAFPLRQQLIEFQNAFRMRHLAEVAEKKEDLPRFLGMNIWKTEVSGDKVDWKPMVVYNPKTEKIEIGETTRHILREALYDDENIANVTFPYLIQGLAMPLPKLAILPLDVNHYPAEMKVSGMDYDWEKGGAAGPQGPAQKSPLGAALGGGGGGGMQRPPAGGMPAAGAEVEFMAKPWRNANLPPEILAKLNDEIYVLDPFGINPDDPTLLVKGPGNAPPPGFGGNNVNPFAGGSPFASLKFWETYPFPPMPVTATPGPGGKTPPTPKLDPKLQIKPWDALIRFFDPDVKPGKTYKYMVQVRMANPNFGKKNDVAFPQLATIAELPPSPPVETPTITIPGEYELFAVDQKPEHPVKDGSDSARPKSDQMVVQIHRWVDETNDLKNNIKQVIGDWAIAERLLVKRGHPVGRIVNVEVPVWHKDKNQFELGASLANVVRGKQPKMPLGAKPPVIPPGANVQIQIMGSGVPVDFAPTNPPPHLVDFDGGERDVHVGPAKVSVKDDSASNLLILQADGKLIVRNSRVDADPNSPEYAARMQRIEEWKKKTEPFRQNSANPGGAGPGLPGLFPGVMQKKGG